MIEIPLTHGKVALVDDCDAHVAEMRWRAVRWGRSWYAVRTARRPGGERPVICKRCNEKGIKRPDEHRCPGFGPKEVRAVARALGAPMLRASDVRLLKALFMFTSIHQKRRCMAALDTLEGTR